MMNAAFKLSLRPPSGRIHAAAATSTSGGGGVPAPTVAAATVVFGYPGASGWECHRESNTEKALLGGWHWQDLQAGFSKSISKSPLGLPPRLAAYLGGCCMQPCAHLCGNLHVENGAWQL